MAAGGRGRTEQKIEGMISRTPKRENMTMASREAGVSLTSLGRAVNQKRGDNFADGFFWQTKELFDDGFRKEYLLIDENNISDISI